jgi:hypothetical protein
MIKDIESATTGQTIWDRNVKGLHIRALQSGKKWYFYYKTKSGKQRKPKLGDYPEISLTEARKMATELKYQIFIGEDPMENWQKQRDCPTVEEAFNELYREHWNVDRFIQSGHAKEVRRNYKNHISKYLGHEKLGDLKVKHISSWHSGLGEHSKTVANRCLAIVSKIIKWAIANEYMTQDLTSSISRHRERKRKRYATAEELVAIHNYLQEQRAQYPQEVLFIYLLMFSGARPSSI